MDNENTPVTLIDINGLNRFKTDISGEWPKSIQVSTMPTASSNLLGKIYQFVGTTTSSYTNGYFYKCVPDTEPGTYKWERVNVQPGGGGSAVQSDWNQTDTTADDYIKNKPDLSTKQDVLRPGTNISIQNDSQGRPVISSIGGSGVSRLDVLDYKGFGNYVIPISLYEAGIEYINAVKTKSFDTNAKLYLDGLNILKPEDSTKTSNGITVEPDETYYGLYHIFGTATNNICISVGRCTCSQYIRTNRTNPDGLYFGCSDLTGNYGSAWFQLVSNYNTSNRKAYVGEGERFHTDASYGNSILYIAFTKNETYDFYIFPLCFPVEYMNHYTGAYVSPLTVDASEDTGRLGGFWGIMPFVDGVILSSNYEISEVYISSDFTKSNIDIDSEIALIHGRSLTVHKVNGSVTPSNNICSITIPSYYSYRSNPLGILFQISTTTISDPYNYNLYQYVISNFMEGEMPTASDPGPRITAYDDRYQHMTISWYSSSTSANNYCYELSFANISL